MDENEEMETVDLVGGPADWAGRTLQVPAVREEPGAYLVSDHTPERDPETEDADPRAVYEPREGCPAHEWHFKGWLPPAAGDPRPEDYLAAYWRPRLEPLVGTRQEVTLFTVPHRVPDMTCFVGRVEHVSPTVVVIAHPDMTTDTVRLADVRQAWLPRAAGPAPTG